MARQFPIVIEEISEDLLQIKLKEKEIDCPYFFWLNFLYVSSQNLPNTPRNSLTHLQKYPSEFPEKLVE